MHGSEISIPAGMSAGFVVVDRRSGSITAARNERGRYRAASLVKLWIALDYLECRGPETDIPAEDRALLESMLRSSDDDAASALWVRGDQQEIIRRTAQRLGLADTHPPETPGMWGYTATTAADVARTYRYMLDTVHPKLREFLLQALRNWTGRASDGFDQSFGIPRAASVPGAIKQGWSGFADPPSRPVGTQADAADRGAHNTGPIADQLDLTRRAMHTSGTVDRDDERIIVVLTLHSVRTSWDTCAQRVTRVTRMLDRLRGTGADRSR
jgi:hypothetical protein